MLNKITDLLENLNKKGIPFPMMRDPKTGEGSVSLTMYWISFNICILTLAGKVANLAGGIEYANTLWLLGITGGMYLGRKFQADKKGITMEGEDSTPSRKEFPKSPLPKDQK